MYTLGQTVLNGDVSMNSNLIVNNKLNVYGDTSLNGKFYAKDIIIDDEGFILFKFSSH